MNGTFSISSTYRDFGKDFRFWQRLLRSARNDRLRMLFVSLRAERSNLENLNSLTEFL